MQLYNMLKQAVVIVKINISEDRFLLPTLHNLSFPIKEQGLLQHKRWPFTMQEVTSCLMKGNLLEGRRPPFTDISEPEKTMNIPVYGRLFC